MTDTQWWRNATVYQIYPLSFADSNGDGYGDLPGIIDRLGHLAGDPGSLGVDALWLSPIYRSPMADFGYDVADHCAVDPRFGTLADADALIREAHRRNLRLLLDYVPNHTSDQHEWFERSRRSRTDPHRDWYVWADPAPDGGPPNNWLSAFERVGAAWTLDEASGQYYLHSYTAEQPDLNWRNPEVRAAMHDVLRFWLDRGVDGFRVDAPHRIGKDVGLADNPADVVDLRIATQLDDRVHRNLGDPFVHEVLRGIRAVTDEYQDAVLVGEVGIHHPGRRLSYYGDADELHLLFDFNFWTNPWDAEAFRAGADGNAAVLEAGGWPTHALSNHDLSRHGSRFARHPAAGAGTQARERVAAVMLATLPGTTFLYYGEEIGMTDVPLPVEQATDPNGRDPERTPMQWDMRLPASGFTTGTPWRQPPDRGVDVATQVEDPDALFTLYRQLLRLRREHHALADGSYRTLDTPQDVYGFQRGSGPGSLVVLLNFADQPRTVALTSAGSEGRVLIGTHPIDLGADVTLSETELRADEAVVIEVAS